MVIFLEIVFKLTSYVLLFLGISWLVQPLLSGFYKLRKRSYRIKKQSSAEIKLNVKTIKIHEHIKLLVNATAKTADDNAVINFYIFTTVLFSTTLIVLYMVTQSIIISVFLAVFIGILPYMAKRFQLAGKRMEISYAFMKEYHIFLQSYQHNRDVYHTMVDTVQSIQDKKLKFAFMRVLSNMQKDRNIESFQESMKLFNYTVNTSFATRFSNLLIKEYRENVDISEALLDLHVDLQKREKDMASMKSKRMETIILGYMPICVIPIFLIMGRQMSIMYSTSAMFAETINVVLFMIALIVAIISAMSAYLLNKPNADI